jgi:hypothetical protein
MAVGVQGALSAPRTNRIFVGASSFPLDVFLSLFLFLHVLRKNATDFMRGNEWVVQQDMSVWEKTDLVEDRYLRGAWFKKKCALLMS